MPNIKNVQHLPSQPTNHTQTPNKPHTMHLSLYTYLNVHHTQTPRHTAHITSHHTFILCFGIVYLVHLNMHGLYFHSECVCVCVCIICVVTVLFACVHEWVWCMWEYVWERKYLYCVHVLCVSIIHDLCVCMWYMSVWWWWGGSFAWWCVLCMFWVCDMLVLLRYVLIDHSFTVVTKNW
jgi:hypothetical protein